MERVYKLGGLETFSIGVILLAGTSFLVYLDMGMGLSLIYRLINTLALCIMAIGIFSLANYNANFARAKVVIILDLILTIGGAVLLPMGYDGKNSTLDYFSLFCSVGAIVLGIAVVYLVVQGCGEIAREKGDESHQANCGKSGKIFLVLTIIGFVALGVVSAMGDALGGVTLFIIIVGGILIVGAHVIMMLRAHETVKLFHETGK